MVARPPAALVEQRQVEGVVRRLASVLAAPVAWGGGDGGGGRGGGDAGAGAAGAAERVCLDEGSVAFAVLSALR